MTEHQLFCLITYLETRFDLKEREPLNQDRSKAQKALGELIKALDERAIIEG